MFFWKQALEWLTSWWRPERKVILPSAPSASLYGLDSPTHSSPEPRTYSPYGLDLPSALPEPEPCAEAKPDLDATLRYYERQRLKHDKFVKPLGEKPPPKKRLRTQEIEPKTPKPKEIEPVIDPEPGSFDHLAIVDTHHEDGGKVLYKVDELFGEFNFRDTVLEQLDRYFVYLKRMQKRDKDAWHLYRQVGATLLPYMSTGSWKRHVENPMLPVEHKPLPPRFNKLRPSFGCYVYGADPETEKFEQQKRVGKKEMWVPKFLYYLKYKTPPSAVQSAHGGDVYMLTIWWDRPDKKSKYGTPQQIPIFISADGKTITALRVFGTSWTHLGGYVSRYAKGKGPASFPQHMWSYPKEYVEWAKGSGDDDVQHFLIGVFLDAITRDEASHMSMSRIAVSRNGMTAVFSVNLRRTSYFFQDRDISVTEGGTRKPIFHMVRPHIRSDGSAVKMHFRGLREFTWAGYRVHISIPGLDHIDINDMDIGAVDEEFLDRQGGWDMKKLGGFLADKMQVKKEQ